MTSVVNKIMKGFDETDAFDYINNNLSEDELLCLWNKYRDGRYSLSIYTQKKLF